MNTPKKIAAIFILGLAAGTLACAEGFEEPPTDLPPIDVEAQAWADDEALAEIIELELERNPDAETGEQTISGCQASMVCLKTADGLDWGCLASVSDDCGQVSTNWSYSGQGVVWYPSSTNARVTLPPSCNPGIPNTLHFEVRNVLGGLVASTSRSLSCPDGESGGLL